LGETSRRLALPRLLGVRESRFQTAERRGVTLRKWKCACCGYVYDEAEGWPDDGIAPGTKWEDVPADWACPDCGASKGDFDMVEV
jgi:rubredoxin